MICIDIVQGEYVESIRISGHANYADIGEDIICASVSSMTVLAFNICEEFDSNIYNQNEDGILVLSIKKYNENIDIVLRRFIITIEELASQYPNNIKVIRR